MFERSILSLAMALCIAGWIYDRQVWQPLQRQFKAIAASKKANNNEGTEQFQLLISDCRGIGEIAQNIIIHLILAIFFYLPKFC